MTPNAPAWARRLALSRATSACRLACFRKPVTLAQGTFGMPATPGRSDLPRGLHIGGRALCGQGGCPCPGHLRHAGQTRLGKAVTLAQGTFGMPARPAWARRLPLPRATSACRLPRLSLVYRIVFFCEKSRHLETKLPKRGQISSLDDSFWSFYRSNRSSRRSSKQSSKRFRSRGLRIEEPKNGNHLPGNPGRVESSLFPRSSKPGECPGVPGHASGMPGMPRHAGPACPGMLGMPRRHAPAACPGHAGMPRHAPACPGMLPACFWHASGIPGMPGPAGMPRHASGMLPACFWHASGMPDMPGHAGMPRHASGMLLACRHAPASFWLACFWHAAGRPAMPGQAGMPRHAPAKNLAKNCLFLRKASIWR